MSSTKNLRVAFEIAVQQHWLSVMNFVKDKITSDPNDLYALCVAYAASHNIDVKRFNKERFNTTCLYVNKNVLKMIRCNKRVEFTFTLTVQRNNDSETDAYAMMLLFVLQHLSYIVGTKAKVMYCAVFMTEFKKSFTMVIDHEPLFKYRVNDWFVGVIMPDTNDYSDPDTNEFDLAKNVANCKTRNLLDKCGWRYNTMIEKNNDFPHYLNLFTGEVAWYDG